MKRQKLKNIEELKVGDTIRNLGSGRVYNVKKVFGDYAVVHHIVMCTNPSEWEVLDV